MDMYANAVQNAGGEFSLWAMIVAFAGVIGSVVKIWGPTIKDFFLSVRPQQINLKTSSVQASTETLEEQIARLTKQLEVRKEQEAAANLREEYALSQSVPSADLVQRYKEAKYVLDGLKARAAERAAFAAEELAKIEAM